MNRSLPPGDRGHRGANTCPAIRRSRGYVWRMAIGRMSFSVDRETKENKDENRLAQ